MVKKHQKIFPKELDGFISLFEFYLEAINETIVVNLQIRTNRNIVFQFINEFVDLLFPENIHKGLSENVARELAGKYSSYLLDSLIDEGLLSLDIYQDYESKVEEEVVRFTFERYSDHIIARKIIGNCKTVDNVIKLFEQGGVIRNLLTEEKYKNAGIITAISLYISEKFGGEFIDYITQDEFEQNEYFFVRYTFEENIKWRSSNGINDTSIRLLNKLRSANAIYSLLLTLSNEPDHPWNILFLEEHLLSMTMAVRDSQWSIYVSDNFEYHSTSSEVLKFLRWSTFVDYKILEKIRIEHLAYVLTWFTSTSNRYVRDTATKRLSRLLYFNQGLIEKVLEKYNAIDDMYILERIYAAVFGAVVYINDSEILKGISIMVYNLQFKDRKPTENIMLREYATLIMEYIQSLDSVHKDVMLKNCKHPFISEWDENEIPSEKELEKFDEVTGLWNSLYGMGDFTKYSMYGVESFSLSPIQQDGLITGETLLETLVDSLNEQSLVLLEEYGVAEEAKSEYLNLIKKDINLKDVLFIAGDVIFDNFWLDDGSELKSNVHYLEYKEKSDKFDVEIQKRKDLFTDSLSDEEKSKFDEFKNRNNNPVEFDKNIIVRYIHNKVIELGWEKELFDSFDSMHGYDKIGYKDKRVERISKKYQWLGLFEAVAKISDNYKWISGGYSDLNDDVYFSASQISLRDIDPTVWIDRTKDIHDYHRENTTAWWELTSFDFSRKLGVTAEQWVSDENILPNFSELLEVIDEKNSFWKVLRGHSEYNQNVDKGDKKQKPENLWYRINTIIINKSDRKELLDKLVEKRLESPDVFSSASFTSEQYYGEFYWQQYFDRLERTRKDYYWTYGECDNNWDFPLHIPTNEYWWESNANDSSFIESPHCYLPSELLIRDLKLDNVAEKYGTWINQDNEIIFKDPSIFENGSSFGLINSDKFDQWLDENSYELIWMIGGEKQVYYNEDEKYQGGVHRRYVFNSAYVENIDGEIEKIYSTGKMEKYN